MIIGVSGKMKSGKNEFHTHLDRLMRMDGNSINEFSFAHNLKMTASTIFNIPYEKSKDREFKEDIYVNLVNFGHYNRKYVDRHPISFDYVCSDFSTFHNDWVSFLRDGINKGEFKRVLITMRVWLQYFGTQICRSEINNFWVNSALVSLDTTCNNICSDVRFENEADAIKSIGGINVRIERESSNSENAHISEVALDSYDKFDYIIHNNGTLEEYHKEIEKFYNEIVKGYDKN